MPAVQLPEAAVRPVEVQNVPAGQRLQAAAPSASAYQPVAQGAQDSEELAPGVKEAVPWGHARQG